MKSNDGVSFARSELLGRRQMLVRSAFAALGLGLAGWPALTRAQAAKRKVLFFSKSSGFEHSVIKRKGGELSFAELILKRLGPEHGVEFTFSKDGALFSADYLAGFEGYMFYTTGDLTTSGTDKNPPMTSEGKAALLAAIRGGKGFVGVHSATDTFHTPEPAPRGPGARAGAEPYHNDGDHADPYIRMIGGEFIMHGSQQKASLRVEDPAFGGMPAEDLTFLEEWYSFKNLAADLHVLLAQETQGMVGAPYQRPPYPATWARADGHGRVFYTSLGHREDVWTNPQFQRILFGGLAWALGEVSADVTPNIDRVTPGYATLPPSK
jgi:type 1 glutamine amidotransferase